MDHEVRSYKAFLIRLNFICSGVRIAVRKMRYSGEDSVCCANQLLFLNNLFL